MTKHVYEKKPFLFDMDICAMYAWQPLHVKTSQLNRLVKQLQHGKSRTDKLRAKRCMEAIMHGSLTVDIMPRFPTKVNRVYRKLVMATISRHLGTKPLSDYRHAAELVEKVKELNAGKTIVEIDYSELKSELQERCPDLPVFAVKGPVPE